MGSQRETFLPSTQTMAASLTRGVPPWSPRPWASAKPLASRNHTRSTPIDLGARKPGRGPMSKVLE